MNNTCLVRSLLVYTMCIFVHAFAFAQPEQEKPSRENKFLSAWNVAAVGIQSDNFDAMSSVVRKTALFLNSLLDDAVRTVPKRVINAEEMIHIKEQLRVKAIASLEKQLKDEIVKQEEKHLLDNKKETWLEHFENQKTINTLKKKIKTVEKLKVEHIPLESSLPIKFIEQSKYLSIKKVQDFQALADEFAAEFVLYFTIDELQDGYIIIKIYSYNAIVKQKQLVMRTILHEEKIPLIQDALQKAINTHLLGALSASLHIEVKVDSEESTWLTRAKDAPILVDGDVVGFGSANLDVIAEGSHSIIVNFQGEQRSLIVDLKPGDKAVRSVLFNTNSENTVTLLSTPPDARVYVNSQWVGNTPTVISRPVGNTADQVELRLSEHEDTRLTINSVAPASISIKLKPSYAVPLKVQLKKRRNRFYTAFAIFGASLIPPIVLNGLYTSENTALIAISNSRQVSRKSFVKSNKRRQDYFYSYIGTAALAGSLAIYAFVELILYLRTASAYHDR